MNTKYIIVSGNIGAGKSTLLNDIKSILPNVFYVQEYIDGEPNGNKMLEDYLNGIITSYDFQDYILNYFKEVFAKIKNKEIILLERAPIEGIETFAYKDLLDGRLTIEQYNTLHEKAKAITPFSINHSIRILGMKDRNENVKKVIHYVNNIPFNALRIELDVKPKICLKNIQIRNRECETNYDLTFIEDLDYLYRKHWNSLSQNQ